MLESNYDIQKLNNSQRTVELKNRIAGDKGHLSNVQCANILSQVVGTKTSEIILLHRSENCNSEDLAMTGANKILKNLGRSDIKLQVAKQ